MRERTEAAPALEGASGLANPTNMVAGEIAGPWRSPLPASMRAAACAPFRKPAQETSGLSRRL